MQSGGKIIIGLIIFLIVVTYPIWGSAITGGKPVPPSLTLGTKEKECVEKTSYMRTSHMKLLEQWRDDVVREGKRIYKSSKGKEYDMSLQNTCTKCHAKKTEFCDRCHNYVDVSPTCWKCHVEPKETKGLASRSDK